MGTGINEGNSWLWRMFRKKEKNKDKLYKMAALKKRIYNRSKQIN